MCRLRGLGTHTRSVGSRCLTQPRSGQECPDVDDTSGDEDQDPKTPANRHRPPGRRGEMVLLTARRRRAPRSSPCPARSGSGSMRPCRGAPTRRGCASGHQGERSGEAHPRASLGGALLILIRLEAAWNMSLWCGEAHDSDGSLDRGRGSPTFSPSQRMTCGLFPAVSQGRANLYEHAPPFN